jgi:16S rRNA (cytosine1402-N4)-methyltransferase
MRRWGAVMLLCTARRAVALLKPLRRPPTRHCSLPGASDYHIPVLGNECIEWLARDDGVFVDCTLGGGGHSSLLLEKVGARAKVIGLDRDKDAIQTASARIRDARFSTIEGVFDEGLQRAFEAHGKFAGVLMDLGVSSHQIDDAERGFSTRFDGPLDMRMGASGKTALDLLNDLDAKSLARLLRQNADEPHASRIAKAVKSASSLVTTSDLASIVSESIPKTSPPHLDAKRRSKAVARVFQALRIEVNDELGALDRALELLPTVMEEGGRVVVLAYHSLEDRRVKRFFRDGKFRGDAARDAYGNRLTPFRPLTRKAETASDEEVAANPRARSARLRVAERTDWSPS